jgi:hypothetical protein
MASILPNYNSNKYAIDESSLNSYTEQQSNNVPKDKTSKYSEDWVNTFDKYKKNYLKS